MSSARQAYFIDDFKKDLFDWAKEKDVIWLNQEAMLYYLTQKPEVQAFIENAGLNFYVFQKEVQQVFDGTQQRRRDATEEAPERLARYNRDNPSFEEHYFGLVSNVITELQLNGSKPDVVDMFAAFVKSNRYFMGDLGELAGKCGLDTVCRERLELKGCENDHKPKPRPAFPGAAPQDLLQALRNPDLQTLIKNMIAEGVEQGIRAHEEKQAKDVSGGMSKGWTHKL